MIDPFYNVNTGDFRGLEKTFSVICVTEDAEQAFFKYVYDKRNSVGSYSVQKWDIPNAIWVYF